MQEGRKIRKQDQETTDKYRTEIRRRVRDKQKKLSEKEEREREKIEELFEHALEYGVWETKKAVEDQVHNLSKTCVCLLLRKQVSFRTTILGQVRNNTCALSRCTRDQLVEILSSLPPPTTTDSMYMDILKDLKCLLNKGVEHRWDESGVDRWYHGNVVGIGAGEIKLQYENNHEPFVMTPSEFLADMFLEDITLS